MPNYLRSPLDGGFELGRFGALPEMLSEEKERQPHWSEKFKYDQYDWNDPEFVRRNKGKGSYVPILLTQGYFMMVSRRDYKLATKYRDGTPKKWAVDIQRDPEGNVTRTYACRRGRAHEPHKVYAHRELRGVLPLSGIVDHKDGWGLDNRGALNLCFTNFRENGSNGVRCGSGTGLPRGVVPVKTKRGVRYIGQRCKRFGKKVVTVRSGRAWKTPGPAECWYKNQLKEIHKGRTDWAHNPTSVSWPHFPPLLEQEISTHSRKLRIAAQMTVLEEVPF